MKSKRKTFLKCGGASLVTVLIPLFLIQQPVLSQELKESATEDISIETVEINTVTSFANEFEITDDGVLAKDKAAEMLERYPTLNANPYALLVKFDDLATPEKTIFSGFILAFRALASSPFETTSAPSPNLFIKLSIFKLELDFTEKQIKGFIGIYHSCCNNLSYWTSHSIDS